MKSSHSRQALAFPAVLVLLLVGSGAELRARQETKVIPDWDVSGAAFRFVDGRFLIIHPFLPPDKVGVTAEEFSTTFDFLLDLPHGILTNNSKFPTEGLELLGQAGIRDCGKKALEEVVEAPTGGYSPILELKNIKEGNTYCFRAADGEHYAKLHVVRFDKEQGERSSLEFTWQYQPKATNKFE